MPSRAGSADSEVVNTASLPMTTPCSLAPISAPHIHHGRERRTAAVRATWGTVVQVQVTEDPAGCSAPDTHSRTWASFGSRSLFLAKSTPSSVTVTRVSHTVGPCLPQAVRAAGQPATWSSTTPTAWR